MDVMFVLTISSIFWQGLKIDGVSPLRWAVSGRKPIYQPKVALQIDGVSPLRWAVSGRSPSSRPKVASTCNLSYFPYHTLILPYCPRTLLGWWEQHPYASLTLLYHSRTLLQSSCTLLYHSRTLSVSLPYTSVHLPYTSVSLPYTIFQPLKSNEIEAIQIDIDSKAY